jgi:Tetrahydrodipicolinate N-succinyltransferase N-terminal
MGIPYVTTRTDFHCYVSGVHSRRDFQKPWACGIGAVLFGADGSVTESYFPQLNRGDNFGSSAAFADVAHHRCGNAVFELGFWELKELEQLFEPFLEEPGHPNVEAYKRVRELSASPYNMRPYVVFVGDPTDDTCRGHPVYEVFMKALVVQSAVGEKEQLQGVS